MYAIILSFAFVFPVVIGNESHETAVVRETYKCPLPELRNFYKAVNLNKFEADYTNLSEVKFLAVFGPLKERQTCKIKCIDGKWVGPLCSSTPGGRYRPVLLQCLYKPEESLITITFKNIVMTYETSFHHGSKVTVRCPEFGFYKLKGENSLTCNNGKWEPKMPECIKTNFITNFTEDDPPAISYTLVSGSAAIQARGDLHVFIDSSLELVCISRRSLGNPEWTSTQPLDTFQPGWASEEGERSIHYRLTMKNMTPSQHNGNYTCTSPTGVTNTVTIKVVRVTCALLQVSENVRMHLTQGERHLRLGQQIFFSCNAGYRLHGSNTCTCTGDGVWSCLAPKCLKIFCPAIKTLSPNLSVVEYNSSFGGRIIFQCSWGYKLIGAPGLECEQDGKWSGEVPQCSPIYCPDPLVPENGRQVTSTSGKEGKYPVGDLIIYACDENYDLVGESSIVCTENGVWSHPPPFCVQPSKVKNADTITVDNTTLIYFDEI